MSRLLYLDAAHQAPLSQLGRARLDAYFDAALFTAGPKEIWLAAVEQVRERLALLIGCSTEDVAFTKNTSEGVNICASGISWVPGDNVLLPEAEHSNNICAWLGKRAAGLEVRLVPADKEWIDGETFVPYVDTRTRAITLSHVMYQTGQRNDVESVIRVARDRRIPVIVDAMQSVGVLPVRVSTAGMAALSSGVHKGLLTPHGLGFLYAGAGNDVIRPSYIASSSVKNPRLRGRGWSAFELRDDARRFEYGNLNLAAIHALDGALELLERVGICSIEEHVLDLGDHLITVLDDLGIGLVGPRERARRSHIYVLDLQDESWAPFFDEQGVRVSRVATGIRVSFGIYNDYEDVARLGELLADGMRSIGHPNDSRG